MPRDYKFSKEQAWSPWGVHQLLVKFHPKNKFCTVEQVLVRMLRMGWKLRVMLPSEMTRQSTCTVMSNITIGNITIKIYMDNFYCIFSSGDMTGNLG